MKPRLIFWIAVVAIILYAEADEDDDGTSMDTTNMIDAEMVDPPPEMNPSVRQADGMQQMYMAVMMAKSFISTIMMFISPVIQLKSFGLAIINTLVNIVRLLLQLKALQQNKMPGGMMMGMMTPSPSPAAWSTPATYTSDYGKYSYWSTEQPHY